MGLTDLVPADTPDRTERAHWWTNAADRIRKGIN
jgi:hypothetical protein